jgi:hypothetical protein
MQLVRPNFFFFGFWGEGERENFYFFSTSMAWRRQSCGNLSHSKEVVARRDRPQVIPSSVVVFFFSKIFCL